MTQEIGFVEPLSGKLDFQKYPIGSLLSILPWHVSIFYINCNNKI